MNRNPLRPVTEADIRSYEEDGVVCLRGMFDREWTDRMREASIRFMESGIGRKRIVQKPGETARFYSNVFMCALDPNFMAFRNESPAAEMAAALMRTDSVRFWYDQIFIKEPGTSAPTQWHHDLPYWPFRGEHLVSLWVAFTPVTKASSGVEYIKGSHKWGKFYRPVTPDEDPAFANPDLEPCPNFGERYGDPIGDNAYAATVRQLLRYFLMLEQEKIVSSAASKTMREIFAGYSRYSPEQLRARLNTQHKSQIRQYSRW